MGGACSWTVRRDDEGILQATTVEPGKLAIGTVSDEDLGQSNCVRAPKGGLLYLIDIGIDIGTDKNININIGIYMSQAVANS